MGEIAPIVPSFVGVETRPALDGSDALILKWALAVVCFVFGGKKVVFSLIVSSERMVCDCNEVFELSELDSRLRVPAWLVAWAATDASVSS